MIVDWIKTYLGDDWPLYTNEMLYLVPIKTNAADIGTILACSNIDACTKWLWFYSKNSKSILLKEHDCFFFRFHWSSWVSNWWYLIIGSGIAMVLNRQQVITNANVNPAHYFHIVLLSHNDLVSFSCMRSGYILIGYCLISGQW